jgi:hypothetical protein
LHLGQTWVLPEMGVFQLWPARVRYPAFYIKRFVTQNPDLDIPYQLVWDPWFYRYFILSVNLWQMPKCLPDSIIARTTVFLLFFFGLPRGD